MWTAPRLILTSRRCSSRSRSSHWPPANSGRHCRLIQPLHPRQSTSPILIALWAVTRKEDKCFEPQSHALQRMLRSSIYWASCSCDGDMKKNARRSIIWPLPLDSIQQAPGSYMFMQWRHDSGHTDEAIKVLEANVATHPYDRHSLAPLANFNWSAGDSAKALDYERRLTALVSNEGHNHGGSR